MKRGWAARQRAPGLGLRIRAAREKKGWNQEELADAVGVSRPAVSEWERENIQNLRIENLFAVATALEMPLEKLVFNDEAPLAGVADESGTYATLPEESLRTMRILDSLPREVGFHLRQLISTLAPITNSRYWAEYVEGQERVVATRKPKMPLKNKP